MHIVRHSQRAFTMLELILVITVLGIVASVGASIITQVYENYIVQRAQYRSNIKTELALNEIANRLRYAIPATVGIRQTDLNSSFESIITTLKENVKVLQWVGYDGDSFEAIGASSRKPGWSGFCDLNQTLNAGGTKIITPGSSLSLANSIIKNLSPSGKQLKDAVLYFADYNGSSHDIASGSGERITLDTALTSGAIISERYKLAWSSYALYVDPQGDLYLYYDFDPHARAAITGAHRSLLLRHVTNFRFKYSGGAFRIKICKKERIGADTNATIHSCKEKVVF